MAHICQTAPILSGYQTYATFHDTSMEDAVIDSHSSMPMTLYFAVCEFSCPEIVFAYLPRRPPDGILTHCFGFHWIHFWYNDSSGMH